MASITITSSLAAAFAHMGINGEDVTFSNVNELEPKLGRTILLNSASTGKVEEVEALLSIGACPNIVDTEGITSLMMAHDHLAMVQVLLDAGANAVIDAVDNLGISALMMAAAGSTKDSLFTDHVAVTRLLVDAGASTTLKVTNSQRTALMEAAEKGNLAIVEILVEKTECINLQNRGGATALILAIKHFDVVECLVNAGADINLADKNGGTALMEAAGLAQPKVLGLLVQHGVEMNAMEASGLTALKIGIMMMVQEPKNLDYKECVKILCNGGALLDGKRISIDAFTG